MQHAVAAGRHNITRVDGSQISDRQAARCRHPSPGSGLGLPLAGHAFQRTRQSSRRPPQPRTLLGLNCRPTRFTLRPRLRRNDIDMSVVRLVLTEAQRHLHPRPCAKFGVEMITRSSVTR
jgi:hypothetical protein